MPGESQRNEENVPHLFRSMLTDPAQRTVESRLVKDVSNPLWESSQRSTCLCQWITTQLASVSAKIFNIILSQLSVFASQSFPVLL